MKKKIIIIAFGAIILLTLLALFFVFRYYYAPGGIEINKERYSITGIDISKHNGKIDWNKIKAQGIDFAYIKATEGETYSDPNYKYNLDEATRVGIAVGAYHFFRFDKFGTKQAANFINNAQIQRLTLPLVVDVEEWGNLSTHQDKELVIPELKRFVHILEKKSRHKVILYSNVKSYNKYIKGHFPGNELWICSFNDPPKIQERWLFWQYSHKGRLDGIEFLVDFNTFNGNRDAWQNYLKEIAADSIR